jgi:hypothetical protein
MIWGWGGGGGVDYEGKGRSCLSEKVDDMRVVERGTGGR